MSSKRKDSNPSKTPSSLVTTRMSNKASNEKDDSGSNDPDGMDNAKIEVDGSENGGSNPSQNGSWTTNGSMLASEALKNGTSQLSALLTQGQNGHGGHG
ncbi:hypothetical protein TCAL_09161, partial [Tigriopus californicus]|eukprot:TCALIF_09161-PA protein Name:"Protein of unknown function" AED:0.18 eAED:0.18 QI:262/1/0.5/1/0/0/2/0/98